MSPAKRRCWQTIAVYAFVIALQVFAVIVGNGGLTSSLIAIAIAACSGILIGRTYVQLESINKAEREHIELPGRPA